MLCNQLASHQRINSFFAALCVRDTGFLFWNGGNRVSVVSCDELGSHPCVYSFLVSNVLRSMATLTYSHKFLEEEEEGMFVRTCLLWRYFN